MFDEGQDYSHMVWCRIDPLGPGLHSPKKDGDVGYDLEAAEDSILVPGEQVDIHTNVRVQLPSICWGEIRARSSIARKGLQVDAGVIDNGYTGPLLVLLRNMSDVQIRIDKGTRVAQLVLHVRIINIITSEVPKLVDDPRRGNAGFGSTGR